MDLEVYLNDPESLARVSEGFSRRSNGVLKGAIGIIDGWLVKITRTCWRLDKVRNVVGFFSRKGLFALNVQLSGPRIITNGLLMTLVDLEIQNYTSYSKKKLMICLRKGYEFLQTLLIQ